MTEKSKLNKKLSITNVWALAFGCIIGWGAFVMPGNTFLIAAGPLGTLIALTIAAIIMIVIAFNYSYMIKKCPIAGGEFTYTQQSFGEKHAFVCAWFLGLSYLTIVPLNATALALIGRNLMGNIFQVGFHYQVAEYDVYLGEVLLAVITLILFAIISIRGVKIAGSMQTVLSIMLVVGVLIVVIAAVFSPKTSIENLFPLWNPAVKPVSGIAVVVAVAPWAFVGFDTIPQAAEEFNFPVTKANMLMIMSIVFGGIVYVSLNAVTASILPNGYETWVEYINDAKNLSGLISLPTFNAAYELLGGVGLLFIGLAVLAAILSGIMGFYMATSRLFYSLAREQVMPEWFGKLHDEYKTPKNAILFTLFVSIAATFIGRNALNWIVDMASIGAAIGYEYTSLAALKNAVKEKNRGIIVTGVLGTICSLIFIIILLVPIDTLGCSLGKESYICLVLWAIFGIIFYCKKNNVR